MNTLIFFLALLQPSRTVQYDGHEFRLEYAIDRSHRVDNRLAGCGNCNREYERFRATITVYEDGQKIGTTPGTWVAIPTECRSDDPRVAIRAVIR